MSYFFLIISRSIFSAECPAYANAITIFEAHFKWFVYIIFQPFFWANLNSGGLFWLVVFWGFFLFFFFSFFDFFKWETASKCNGVFSQLTQEKDFIKLYVETHLVCFNMAKSKNTLVLGMIVANWEIFLVKDRNQWKCEVIVTAQSCAVFPKFSVLPD